MWKLGSLCVILGLLTGCQTGSSVSAPATAFAGIARVAVVAVNGPYSEDVKNQIADFVAAELLRKGFVPVERQQVRALLAEQQFQQSEVSSTDGASQAGRILNVPAVIVLNVPQYDDRMNLTAKMIKVDEGSVLWAGSGTASGGGLVGNLISGVGRAVGRKKSDPAVGAVAVTSLLSSQQAKLMQSTIAKMFEGLIQRPAQ